MDNAMTSTPASAATNAEKPRLDPSVKPLPPTPTSLHNDDSAERHRWGSDSTNEGEGKEEREIAVGSPPTPEQDIPSSMRLPVEIMISPNRLRDSPSPKSMSTEAFGPSALRPIAERRATAPEPSTECPTMPTLSKLASLTIQPRSRSPFGTHLSPSSIRSPNSATSPAFPRSKSLPYLEVARPSSPLHRPASPFSSAGRRVSPLRRPFEDHSSFSGVEIDQTISENSELELEDATYLKPRPHHQHSLLSIDPSDSGSSTPTTPVSPYTAHGTFPRGPRRRPSSPLHIHLHSPGRSGTLHTSASSPALRSPAPLPVDPAKYNEAFPQPTAISTERSGSISSGVAAPPPSATSVMSAASVSSMPSTPSSFRSRSPSISSLETIPDSPEAEAEAERDRDALARLRAVASAQQKSDDSNRLQQARGRTMGRLSDGGVGNGTPNQEKRKRWSVSGAERRGDLEMETIWED